MNYLQTAMFSWRCDQYRPSSPRAAQNREFAAFAGELPAQSRFVDRESVRTKAP